MGHGHATPGPSGEGETPSRQPARCRRYMERSAMGEDEDAVKIQTEPLPSFAGGVREDIECRVGGIVGASRRIQDCMFRTSGLQIQHFMYKHFYESHSN
jgi:hypothetical protein